LTLFINNYKINYIQVTKLIKTIKIYVFEDTHFL